jgi:hypothetical protein
MVVTSVGKPRLLHFILGITAILVAVGFTLSLYDYWSKLASYGSSLIMEPAEIPRLFLFFFLVLGLGILGGYEIGTFAGAQKKAGATSKLCQFAIPTPRNQSFSSFLKYLANNNASSLINVSIACLSPTL